MINLFTNYYIDKNPARQKEIEYCLCKNLSNPMLNVVVLNSQNRLSYSFYFRKINLLGGHDDINIIANSDIYFESDIKIVEKMTANQCFALSRWDIDQNGNAQHYDHSDSQDAWIFRGKIKQGLNGEFNLGVPGCDNRIAYEINRAGYLISNPSKTVKSYHVHQSDIRNYGGNKVPPPYMNVHCSILT